MWRWDPSPSVEGKNYSLGGFFEGSKLGYSSAVWHQVSLLPSLSFSTSFCLMKSQSCLLTLVLFSIPKRNRTNRMGIDRYRYRYTYRLSSLVPWQRIHLPSKIPGFDHWVGKMPRRKKWQLSPVFLPGKSYGQSGLAGQSPWGSQRESDMT